jgi:hypothetical protein
MTCGWIFGRGASIAHGLSWGVPTDWYEDHQSGRLSRDDLIQRIVEAIQEAVRSTDARHYAQFLKILLDKTEGAHAHVLTTTNWDFLLQLSIDQHRQRFGVTSIPHTKVDGVVYHMNGSVEPGPAQNRSKFILEIDGLTMRRSRWALESQLGIDRLVISNPIVVIGMSFECAGDRSFMSELARLRRAGTYDGADLVLVDPDQAVLTRNHIFLRDAFQRVTVEKIPLGLEEWVTKGMPTSKVSIFRKTA